MLFTDSGYNNQNDCKRRSKRTPFLTAGLLVGPVGDKYFHCLIREMSLEGAQLRMNAAACLPETGFLINLEDRIAYRVRTVWRKSSLMGVKCEETHAISDALPAELVFLKRHFIDAKLRQVDQMIADGMQLVAALRRCRLPEQLYWQERG
jgi:hypothetical protein